MYIKYYININTVLFHFIIKDACVPLVVLGRLAYHTGVKRPLSIRENSLLNTFRSNLKRLIH